ncbi:MAG: GxxExxY protein [Anaerolineales bacterium]|jgi:GxxExxY protein
MTELIYKDEVYQIIGAAMKVYNQLGNGFLEAVYQDALDLELGIRQIAFQEQVPLELSYKGQILRHTYIPDLIMFDKIIVELKAISALGPNEEAQLLNYLKATGMRLGLLINFGAQRKLEWKRMIS